MRRSRTTLRSAAGALLATGALLTTAFTASAAPAAPASPPPVAVHEAEHAEGFWTAERMREAQPLDLIEAERGEAGKAVPRGEKRTIAPTGAVGSGIVETQAFPEAGGPWTGGGDVVATSGRVFFTYGGRTASCSGNAVTSANRSTVMTAGHCVKLEGNWHTNWVFVPAYHDGQAPYGRWSASELLATPQWVASEDINYDIGAAVVDPLDGQLLTDVVGGQGLAFNTGYNVDMYAFGFPAAAPYDGESLIYCSGTTFQDFLLSSDHGMSCDMTGGSSGGPWFTQFDEASGAGLQSSVNSFKYNFLPGYMFGPYFGADAENLYNEAQAS